MYRHVQFVDIHMILNTKVNTRKSAQIDNNKLVHSQKEYEIEINNLVTSVPSSPYS